MLKSFKVLSVLAAFGAIGIANAAPIDTTCPQTITCTASSCDMPNALFKLYYPIQTGKLYAGTYHFVSAMASPDHKPMVAGLGSCIYSSGVPGAQDVIFSDLEVLADTHKNPNQWVDHGSVATCTMSAAFCPFKAFVP